MKSVESTYGKAKAGAGAVVSALVLMLLAGGCGSSATTPKGTPTSVSGLVASDPPASQAITVKDSSSPAQVRTGSVDSSGAYEVDVSGLTPPYLVEAKDDSGKAHYALATQPGSTNVNGLSDAVLRAASDDDEHPATSYRVRDVEDLIVKLRTVLAPLFQHYGITFGDDMEDSAAYRTMLSEVSFTVSNGTLTVKNRATGAVIYSAPLKSLASGVLHPEAIPGGTPSPTPAPTPTPTPTPTPSTCTYTYDAWSACQPSGTQSRTVATAVPAGCTGTPVLTQACTYTAPTCSYTYSTWNACQADGTQTRALLSTTPSGCTGTPILSQSCTYVPPVVSCTSFTYSAWSTCSASGTQSRTVTGSSPSGCTGGTPVVSQSCTPPAPTNPVTSANIVSSCTTCHGLTSNTTVFKSGGYTVSGRSASQWLTTVNNMVGLGASLAPGTTAQNYADYLANVP